AAAGAELLIVVKCQRYLNDKCGAFTFLTFHFYFSSVRFDNIITEAQTQACSFSGWFCSKKWLKYFICYFLRNTIAVVTNGDAYTIFKFLCSEQNGWFIKM